MIAAPLAGLEARASALAARLGDAATVVELRATVGGGSLPGETLASAGVAIAPGPRRTAADRLLRQLRLGEPIVIGRIEDGRVVLDLRTVDPARDEDLVRAVERAAASAS